MNLPVLKIFIQELAFHQELQEQYKKHIATPLWERLTMVIEHFQQKKGQKLLTCPFLPSYK